MTQKTTSALLFALLLSLLLAPTLLAQEKRPPNAASSFVASGRSLSESARRQPSAPGRLFAEYSERVKTDLRFSLNLAQANKLSIGGNASIGKDYYNVAAPPDGMIIQGNVGIGTPTPSAKLEVNGSIVVQGCTGCGSGTSQWVTNGSNIYFNTGKVGIGINSPGAKLEVQTTSGIAMKGQTVNDSAVVGVTNSSGNSNAGVYALNQGSGSAIYATVSGNGSVFYAETAGDGAGVHADNYAGGPAIEGRNLRMAGSGNVGVSGESFLGAGVLGISHNNGLANAGVSGRNELNGAGIYGQAKGTGPGVYGESTSGHGVKGVISNSSPDVAGGFFTNTGGGPALLVIGKVSVNGTTSTKIVEITGGSDFSEKFEVKAASDSSVDVLQQIQPGLLVSIDPHNPGKLVVSSQAYDRKVAGIISGAGGVKTGVLMGQANSVADGDYPVALSGRVYCWADAANGPIEPGDLLTTSNIPGHAMKVINHTKAQGAIIGKAMTGLKRGKGLVLVLVTLQ